jgi:hypothetical protein
MLTCRERKCPTVKSITPSQDGVPLESALANVLSG